MSVRVCATESFNTKRRNTMRKIIVQVSVLGLAPFLSFQLMAQQNSTTNVSTSVSAPSQWAASVKSEISNNLN